jgi:hypothetical protein
MKHRLLLLLMYDDAGEMREQDGDDSAADMTSRVVKMQLVG